MTLGKTLLYISVTTTIRDIRKDFEPGMGLASPLRRRRFGVKD
jgi:hypothetical protein